MPGMSYRLPGETRFMRAVQCESITTLDENEIPPYVLTKYSFVPTPPWAQEEEKEAKKEEEAEKEVSKTTDFGEFVKPEKNDLYYLKPPSDDTKRKITYVPIYRTSKDQYEMEKEVDYGSMTDLSNFSNDYYSDENEEDRLAREGRNLEKMTLRQARLEIITRKYFPDSHLEKMRNGEGRSDGQEPRNC